MKLTLPMMGLALIVVGFLQQPITNLPPSRKAYAEKVSQPVVQPVPTPTPTPTQPVVVQDVPTDTPAPTPPPAPEPAALDYSNYSHADLMSAAGIAPSDYPAVDYIISHESGWNPDATEPNSGAHGLPQILPYSKSGCGWEDALCQLQWADTYATSRYGGWWGAYNHWISNQWW